MAEPDAAGAALAASVQQQLETVRAEAARQQLEAEQSLHDLTAKLATAEAAAEAARKDCEGVKEQLAQEQARREEAERKVTLAEEGRKGDTSKEDEYRRRLEKADKEKRELLEALEREQREREATEESLTSLRAAHASLQTAHSDLEGKLAEANSTSRTSLLRLQTLQSTVSSLEADKTFLTAELERGRTEWSTFRREKHAELVRLQGELETKTIDAHAAQTSLENLRKAHEQLKARHEETLSELAKVREELGANEGHFATEMASMRRLVELMEKREAERKKRLEDVEKALEEERAAMQEREAELQDQLLSERERADDLDARNADLREALERGNAAARPAGEQNLGSPGAASNASGSFMLSPAGQLAVRGQKSGRSYAEIYGEYIKMEEELAAERLETKRLSEVLAQILADIEERAPMLKEQRLEYERLSIEATELASQLAQALTDRDGSERRSKSLRLDVERLSTDNTILNQQLSDLGRQVRVLARALAAKENPSLGDANEGEEEEEAIMRRAEQLGDTDSVVSAHLVTFSTINELQAQNQKLLKITRQMGRQLEQGEQDAIARRDDEENKAVAEAHELILQLKEEIESQRARTEAYEKERDMFRRMLAQRGSAVSTGSIDNSVAVTTTNGDVDAARMLAEVQANFDAYRTEMSVDSQKLRDDLAQAQKDAAAARTELAKSKAQAEFMTERFRLLTDSYEMQKTEMSQMSKRALELQQTLARHDMSTHKMSEEQIELRSAVDQLRHENNNLKSEREVLKSVEKRLGEENATLSKERAHLADLMRNLQSMQNELERSGNDARRRLEENVARLEAQAADLREKINAESDNARQTALRREIEAKTFQERIDRLTAEHGSTREKLVAAETSQSHLEERVRDLALQVEAKEEKLAMYEGRNGTGDASQSPEEQLQSTVAELRNELRSVKGELERAKEHVKQYQVIAETQGVSLQEVTATYEEYKTTMDAATAEKDSELASLRERLHAITTDLTASNNQNSDLHRQIEAERVAFEKERKTFEDGMAALRSADQQARDAQIAAQDDMRRQAQVARDAHEKYERELVAHAEDVKRLSEVKGELEAVRATVREHQAAADTAKANLHASEESWKRQKDVLQQELADVRKRSDELKEQNGILADHLEKATASAATLQSRHATNNGDASDSSATPDSIEAITASHNSSVEQLREVIRYLRREKDIIDLQLDFSKQEATRLRQQLDFTSRSLEEARQALQEERQRAGDTLSSSAQHAELLESIHTAKLLRESNQTLRDENEANVRKLATLDTQLRQVQAEIQPLQEQLRSLQAELEAKDHQIKLLEEDNERWKTRNQTILAKYERIDPEELQVLKAEVDKVQASLATALTEKAAISEQFEEQTKVVEAQRVQQAEASARFRGLQELARAQRSTIDGLKKEVEELKKEIEELKKAAEDSKQQAATAPAENPAAADALEKQQRIDALQAEKSTLESEKTALETKLAAVESEKAEALKEVEARLATVQAAHDTVSKERERLAARELPIFNDNKQMRVAVKAKDAEIAAKDAELATLRSELETLKASIAGDNAAAIEAVVQARLAEAAPPPAAPTDEQVAAAAKEQLAAAEARFAEQREEAIAQAVKQAATQFEQELEKVRTELTAARAAASLTGDAAAPAGEAEATKKAVEEAVESAKRELTADFGKVKEAATKEAVRKEQETIARLDAALKEAQEQVKTATEAAAKASSAPSAGAPAPSVDIDSLVQAKVAALDKERAATQQQAIEKAVQDAIAKQQQVVKKAVADALARQAAEHEKLLTSTKEQAERQAAMKNNLLQKSLNGLRQKLAEKEKESAAAAAAGGNAPPAAPANTPPTPATAPAPKGLTSLLPPPASLPTAPATPTPATQTAQSPPATAQSDASPGRGGGAAGRGRGGLARRGGRGGKAGAPAAAPASAPAGPKATAAPPLRQAKGPGGMLGSILGAAAAANAQSQAGGAKRARESEGDGAGKGGPADPSKRPKP